MTAPKDDVRRWTLIVRGNSDNSETWYWEVVGPKAYAFHDDVSVIDSESYDAMAARVIEAEVGIERASRIYADMKAERDAGLSEFKNFHRSLCKRFGYAHDEQDWKRDQASLEEHIAKGLEREAKLLAALKWYAQTGTIHDSNTAREALAEHEKGKA